MKRGVAVLVHKSTPARSWQARSTAPAARHQGSGHASAPASARCVVADRKWLGHAPMHMRIKAPAAPAPSQRPAQVLQRRAQALVTAPLPERAAVPSVSMRVACPPLVALGRQCSSSWGGEEGNASCGPVLLTVAGVLRDPGSLECELSP